MADVCFHWYFSFIHLFLIIHCHALKKHRNLSKAEWVSLQALGFVCLFGSGHQITVWTMAVHSAAQVLNDQEVAMSGPVGRIPWVRSALTGVNQNEWQESMWEEIRGRWPPSWSHAWPLMLKTEGWRWRWVRGEQEGHCPVTASRISWPPPREHRQGAMLIHKSSVRKHHTIYISKY